MSPSAKHNTKWIVTITSIVIGILATVVTSTAKITTKFNQNDADHKVIIMSATAESERSRESDGTTAVEVKQIRKDVQSIDVEQAVMTNILQQQHNTLVEMSEDIKSLK